MMVLECRQTFGEHMTSPCYSPSCSLAAAADLEAVRIVLLDSADLPHTRLVLSFKRWLKKEWQVKVQHVSRERNRVADKMVAKGRTQRGLTTVFTIIPEYVKGLVDVEKAKSEPVKDGLAREGTLHYQWRMHV
ncbi:hypothetical protein V6N12_047686 [Hibiscus sabdariffa]|uniref:RNase H type-1 domain-containing protein n=1 Tax=Hibiscus sabdariffa TaxID=183260 RepID=A0ABR2CTP6_9ROSI